MSEENKTPEQSAPQEETITPSSGHEARHAATESTPNTDGDAEQVQPESTPETATPDQEKAAE